MDHYKFYLGGRWSEGIEGKVMKNLNPATGVPFALVHVATDADVDGAHISCGLCLHRVASNRSITTRSFTFEGR